MTRKSKDKTYGLHYILDAERRAFNELLGGWEAALQAMEDLQKLEAAKNKDTTPPISEEPKEAEKRKLNQRKNTNGK